MHSNFDSTTNDRNNNLLTKISSKDTILDEYINVRAFTEKLCEPLETEDYLIQTMPDISPTKWHLAHTTWFWETFILSKLSKDYKSPNELYDYLFNSYYVQVGKRWSRPDRGLLSRPTVKEVYRYRKIVDEQMIDLIQNLTQTEFEEIIVTLNIGLNHEQQHQELMLTDIKNVFAFNPLYPVYSSTDKEVNNLDSSFNWITYEGGLVEVGYKGEQFYFDNEQPVHKVFLKPYKVANKLVTNKEFIDFIEDGGYSNTPLWLSEGSAAVETNKWKAPLYWNKEGDKWFHYTLNGYKEVNPAEPVCHVSFYEAEAYAHWADSRLITEFEWEHASENQAVDGNFVDNELYHPIPAGNDNGLKQMYGDVWEWTRSDYAPYPGYKVPPGAIGEYNGKFMSGQYVLRGGSCATSKNHIRNTYRNFFPPSSRWQFMGIRLAKDLG
jgi:ergothioneine biosynthesis protein EgtB